MRPAPSRASLLAFAALLCAPAPAATATPWELDRSASSIGFETRRSGTAVRGSFERFEASADPAPDGVSIDRLEIVVHLDGVSMRSATYRRWLLGAWGFDVERFPTATFVSTDERLSSEGDDPIGGRLRIRDRGLDLSVPAIRERRDGRLSLRGEVRLNRLSFDIGRGDDRMREGDVSTQVVVSFELVLVRPTDGGGRER